MEKKAQEFLWSLIDLCWLSGNSDESLKLAMVMCDQKINLPSDLQELVVEFGAVRDETLIEKIALICANRCYFTADRHIVLAGLLFENGVLAVNDIAVLLAKIMNSGDKKISSDSHLRRVIDVAWLVNEDSKDGFMKTQDDSLLQDALKEMLAAERLQGKV